MDEAIAEWRRQFMSAGIQDPLVLDELESHLRDDVEQQVRAGVSAEQAFDAARQRMGQPRVLRGEFKKGEHATPVVQRKAAWALIGLAFLGCWIQFGQSPAVVFVYGMLLAGLIVATFTDVTRFVIPDAITIGGALAGLLCSVLLPSLHGQENFAAGLLQSLLGIGVGAGLLYLVLRLGKWAFGRQPFNLGKDPRIVSAGGAPALPEVVVMGMGDVKFMAAIGAFLGWQAVVFSLMFSSLLGSIVGCGLVAARRRQWSARIPFGPYLAAAAAVWVFAGKQLLGVLLTP